jgi:hypothetical protein
MIGLLLMLQAAALTAPPSDWSALPPLRLTQTPDYTLIMTKFVHDEVAAGRCAAPAPVAGKVTVKLDLIVLVASATNQALRVVPRAINCPTVEQFAAGVIEKAARDNIAGPAPGSDSWYHTSMTITWSQ